MIPLFEQAKTIHALDSAASVISPNTSASCAISELKRSIKKQMGTGNEKREANMGRRIICWRIRYQKNFIINST
jgi:hypothetical protein